MNHYCLRLFATARGYDLDWEAHAAVANRLINSVHAVDSGYQAPGQTVGVCVWDSGRLYKRRVSVFVVNTLYDCRTFLYRICGTKGTV